MCSLSESKCLLCCASSYTICRGNSCRSSAEKTLWDAPPGNPCRIVLLLMTAKINKQSTEKQNKTKHETTQNNFYFVQRYSVYVFTQSVFSVLEKDFEGIPFSSRFILSVILNWPIFSKLWDLYDMPWLKVSQYHLQKAMFISWVDWFLVLAVSLIKIDFKTLFGHWGLQAQ